MTSHHSHSDPPRATAYWTRQEHRKEPCWANGCTNDAAPAQADGRFKGRYCQDCLTTVLPTLVMEG